MGLGGLGGGLPAGQSYLLSRQLGAMVEPAPGSGHQPTMLSASGHFSFGAAHEKTRPAVHHAVTPTSAGGAAGQRGATAQPDVLDHYLNLHADMGNANFDADDFNADFNTQDVSLFLSELNAEMDASA